MNPTDLVSLRRDGLDISIDPTFFEKRDAWLEAAKMLNVIESPQQYDMADKIVNELAEMRRGVEKARKELKEPFLKASKDIDAKAKEALTNVSEEETRIGRIAGDYKAIMAARERAATVLAGSDVPEDERAYYERIAAATTIEEIDAIREERDKVNGSKGFVALAPAVIDDSKVKPEWDITVTDIHALYRSHPGCVELSPRLSAIKEVLNSGSGQVLKGVTYKRVNALKAKR